VASGYKDQLSILIDRLSNKDVRDEITAVKNIRNLIVSNIVSMGMFSSCCTWLLSKAYGKLLHSNAMGEASKKFFYFSISWGNSTNTCLFLLNAFWGFKNAISWNMSLVKGSRWIISLLRVT
jgi:hypothetical protein